MKKRIAILAAAGCVVLGVLVGVLVSHLGSAGQDEIQGQPDVIDITEGVEDDGLQYEFSEDGTVATLVGNVTFADHGVTYDQQIGEDEVSLAGAGAKTFVLSSCSRMSRDVLSEYFTDWACQVIEQNYDEEFVGREAPQLEVVKATAMDGYVEVFLKQYNYDQYKVYFKDGKIDNVEYVRTFFDESEF